MKTLAIRPLFAALLLFAPISALAGTSPRAAAPQAAGPHAPAPQAAAPQAHDLTAEPQHVVTEAEIQAGIDQAIHSEAADRQAIRDLLARPEVRRIAGQAGLSLTRANDAIPMLSGAELQRLAAQAREVNSQALAGDRISMNSTTLIIILLIVVLSSCSPADATGSGRRAPRVGRIFFDACRRRCREDQNGGRGAAPSGRGRR
jgi:hypothetical protein